MSNGLGNIGCAQNPVDLTQEVQGFEVDSIEVDSDVDSIEIDYNSYSDEDFGDDPIEDFDSDEEAFQEWEAQDEGRGEFYYTGGDVDAE